MISNIIESNVPLVADRNYAPERTFVTKWDVEIENTRVKKISRGRERDTKYFDDFDQHSDSLPVLKEAEELYCDCGWELESDDGEGEETRQAWLRAVEAENAYYDRKYGELKDNFDWYDMNQPQTAPCKRNLDFDEYGMVKRIRA
jgi:hypothetical protein